jgi:hypothetical protein
MSRIPSQRLISQYATVAFLELREAGRSHPDRPTDDSDLAYRGLEYYVEYCTITPDGKVHQGNKEPWNCDHNGRAASGNLRRWMRLRNERNSQNGIKVRVIAAALYRSRNTEFIVSLRDDKPVQF